MATSSIEDYTNLGYANGWKIIPKEVCDCRHPLSTESNNKCVTTYICHKCKYFYKVDSSD